MRIAKGLTEPADRKIEVVVAPVPPAYVDGSQIAAALAEVIDNALLATDATTGRLSIRADPDPQSSRVVLTVADNGHGMDDSTLKRAFDPFFSNKPAGRRRGMGLPKALRWVESNGGSMRLESRIGRGTRAVIVLPAATEPRPVPPRHDESAVDGFAQPEPPVRSDSSAQPQMSPHPIEPSVIPEGPVQ